MSQNGTSEKEPNETPALTKLGKVEEVTQGNLTPTPDVTSIGSQ